MATTAISETGESRRTFLNISVGLFSVATALGMLYPVGMFLWPREKKVEEGGVRSMQIPLAETPVGEAKFIRFLNKAAVVIRPNEQQVVALSAVCTHLGCVVKWKEDVAEFVCPCHGGRFDTKGKVLGGPPPTPLVSFKATIEDEYIVISEA